MKRIGNIYHKIWDLNNLVLAERRARKGKSHQYGVKMFDRSPARNFALLQESLVKKTFRTSPYKTFIIREPKERMVYKLPYYPDRIVQHAIVNVLKGMFESTYTADTYSCIEGRGIHLALKRLNRALKDKENTQYCLKMDIKKFYPSINHDILKQMLRKKIKDESVLWIMDEIIDSALGIPIGNYLSQYLGNFYLAYFDHFVKEELKAKYLFRYCDDVVILAKTKPELHYILQQCREYLKCNLKLEIKQNYQIFPVDSRGIDFVGYVTDHDKCRIRKKTKQNFAKMLKFNPNRESTASYTGLLSHGNCINLTRTLLKNAA